MTTKDEEYVYHVTYYSRLAAIAERGLVPGRARSIGASSYDAHAAKGVFFTDLEGVFFWFGRAEAFAEHGSDDVLADEMIPVVLRTPSEVLDLEEDELGTDDAKADAWICACEVAPDELEVFDPKEGWILVEGWQDLDVAKAVTVEIEPADEDDEDSEEVELHYLIEARQNPFMPPEAQP